MLRDGPEALPRSWFLLVASLLVIWSALIAESYLITIGDSSDHMLSIALLVTHILAFWIIVNVAGHSQRFLQAITASAACGALVSILSLILYLAFVPVMGVQNAGSIPGALHLWLLMVDGHIIARSIEQHLLTGIGLMIVVFFTQVAIYSAF